MVWGSDLAASLDASRVALGSATRSRTSWPIRLLLVPASVGAGLLLVDALSATLTGGDAFLVLLVPVMLWSLALGARWGLASMVIGGSGVVLLVLLRDHPWLSDPSHLIRLGLYLGVGGGLVVLGSLTRDAGRGSRGHDRVTDPSPPTAVTRPVETLTLRELDVLRLAAGGSTVEEIGHELYLSRNTVKSHLAHAYGKLGVHNRAEAVAAGLRAGLLDVRRLGQLD